MTGYRPSSIEIPLLLVGILAATIALGLLLTRRRRAWAPETAWLLAAAAVGAAERVTAREPGGLRMLALCAALFFGMKAIVGVSDLARGAAPLSSARWLAFTVGWPGMWPRTFARKSGPPRAGGGRLLTDGLLRFAAGAALVGAARLVWIWSGSRWVATALLLPGLSFMLHFGLFTIAAGLWRWAGFPCKPLFRAPLSSTSLSEFWGKRWNIAFTEMIQLSVYRPLAARVGTAAAAFAGFLFSGLLHEVAITLPARGGYGRPLLYFALQGGLVLLERALSRSGHPIDRRPGIGRIWTLAALALPLPILLVPEFLQAAIWPIIGTD
jgi:alginate O-acetyltransferase complex protein AlgI